MKVCILYGWAEGSAHGKRLREALKTAGMSATRDPKTADIIIAHSGGGYLLPSESKARLVILAGLPYWPGRHPAQSLPAKVRSELHDLWWYKKTFFNSFYFITKPHRWIRMWRRWKRNALPALEDASIILVRHDDDHFMHPTDTKSLADAHNWELRVLPGQHDDIWRHPEPYIDLINKSVPMS